VGLFSTFEESDNDYGSLNGTSMSAPNATGTFALLQELHMNLHGGIPMKSAELKALIAHTALEAGISDGPDYRFGWGLIDAKSAAQYLIQENTTNKLRIPISLEDGGEYEYSFTPTNGTKVTATVCWNDVPGTPPPAQLDPTQLMLVNDLDMVIIDGSSSHLPWILDPQAPGIAATKGNNFRDNIEKIEFISDGTEATLTLNHKNAITGDSQEAFLVLSFETESAPKTFYWTGSTGSSWNDLSNWSDASGGSSVGSVPTSNDLVVIDNNSFDAESGAIQLSQSTNISSILSLQDQEIQIDLNGFDFTILGNASLSNITFTGEGNVIFSGNSENENSINLGSSLEDASIVFQGETVTWKIKSDCVLGDVQLTSGNLMIQNIDLTMKSFEALGSGLTNIDFTGSELTILNELILSETVNSISDEGTIIDAENNNVTIITDLDLNAHLSTSGGTVSISGLGAISSANLSGIISIADDFEIGALTLQESWTLIVSDGITLTMEEFFINSSFESRVSISSATHALILIDERQKICFDFIDVTNVSFSGDAVISVGESGTL
ncbi:MAG: S8 family serine peptidase, partial [Cyclobacteriaceae bacterium]